MILNKSLQGYGSVSSTRCLVLILMLYSHACSNERGMFGSSQKQDASDPSGAAPSEIGSEVTPGPNGTQDSIQPSDESAEGTLENLPIVYDPLSEKERIELIIEASDLTRTQKDRAIAYVRNSDHQDVKTVGGLVKGFIEGLIDELPDSSKDSLVIVAESARIATDNLQLEDQEKIAEVRQQILQTVLLQASVAKKIDQIIVGEVTEETVLGTGYWPPEKNQEIIESITASILQDPEFISLQSSIADRLTGDTPNTQEVTTNTDAPAVPEEIPVLPPPEVINPLQLLNRDQFIFWAHYETEGKLVWESENQMRIDVTKLMDGSIWHVQLLQRITLVQGKTYKVSFTASATKPIQADLSFSEDGSPYTSYHHHVFSIETTPKVVDFTFTYKGA